MTVRTEVHYGPDPCQVVTIRRNGSKPQRTVIFLHGGGWRTGGRTNMELEAKTWAADGWTTYNAEYRLGKLDGVPGDGKAMLQDVHAILELARSSPYVDKKRIVVYGESAGGHLATWVGSFYGPEVRAIVAVSPVSSIAGAIIAGRAPDATGQQIILGQSAQEFFGYSVGTTDAHRYLDRVQVARIVVGVGTNGQPDEWVDPDIHGRKLCKALTKKRCQLTEVPGSLHAGSILDANPALRTQLRAWALKATG